MAFPNGLTFDRRGNLYVTDSALGGALVGLDGIVADERGRVFGAVNVQNAVVVISPDGAVSPVTTDGLDFPVSLAFGTRGADRHALFITNFALANEVDPSPGIVRLEVGPPGRRWQGWRSGRP